LLVAESPRGLCHLSFQEQLPSNPEAVPPLLSQDWPLASFLPSPELAQRLLPQLFHLSPRFPAPSPLRAYVRGSSFQVKVWRALLRIPPGHLVSYGQLARHIQHPRAIRALGSAVARNPLACLIPCHRVIRETGLFGHYRWNPTRKQALIAWEGSRTTLPP
ncbi:MAG: methylated-DNA--[protein]-cysteine S-methyltransferase, partial [Blastochloris sp.]|nr:methylated-DNA--[protein]-cysteine S-methyltransferase [Blastochloris sp.]